MRALINSPAPFWFGLFLFWCMLVFFALLAVDEYIERAARRHQLEVYRSEGMA
jgi:hypothetical protein